MNQHYILIYYFNQTFLIDQRAVHISNHILSKNLRELASNNNLK
jgi:hypothetical protein